MKNRIIIALTVLLLMPAIGLAQHHGSFQKYLFIRDTDTLPYRMLLPARFNPLKQYPLIIFLHGSGERGNNNSAQLNYGGNLFIRDSLMLRYPAIVVFPQCAKGSSWVNPRNRKDTTSKLKAPAFPKLSDPTKEMKLVIELLSDLKQNFLIDTDRLYVGGLSMGGLGVYDIVNRMPEKFAAAFVICGAGDTATAKNMKETAWWLFHGEKDSAVLVKNSRIMAEALEKAGAEVKLTIYPDVGHDSWNNAFKEPGLLQWMFNQKLNK